MNLHKNKALFSDAMRTTAEELNISAEFVEKDYWICLILQRLSRHPMSERIVWKGGTSLTKAYGLIDRFSSDVDFAILAEGLSQNQQKKLVMRIGKDITADLEEFELQGKTIKNNRYRKTYHKYESAIRKPNRQLDFLGNHVVVEINTYGNPYPYEIRPVRTFISEMMERKGLSGLIDEYDMGACELNVLDKRRTLCEKVVSLLRFSFEDDAVAGLSSKIRHFYDLHFLIQDADCQDYLNSDFTRELTELIEHDKNEFDKPAKWKSSPIESSPLIQNFNDIWNKTAGIYRKELGALAYREIPAETQIAQSMEYLLEKVKMELGRGVG